jgi:hypothetical protein
MARPKTKSDPVIFRLPIHLWPFLEARAERQKLGVSDYVASVIRAALEKDEAQSKELKS